ncbi:unnamed protein product, partial [Cylicostephanus goldi]
MPHRPGTGNDAFVQKTMDLVVQLPYPSLLGCLRGPYPFLTSPPVAPTHFNASGHKLATLFPSIQCCLALMFAAERYADARLRADTENIIGSTFHLQMDLLRSYISMMERVVNDHGMCSTHQHSSAPTEAELLAHSPGGQCGSPSLGTPHNDSGFCSG